MSVLSADARVDGDEDDRLHEDAGEQELDVVAGRPGERAAEHVREQQREHDRRDRHVEQLNRDVLDLEHAAPAERAGAGRRRGRAGRSPDSQRGDGPARAPGCARRSVLDGAHAGDLLLLGVVLGRTAGEREEDVVEARLAEREVGDAGCRAHERGERLRRLVGARGTLHATAPAGSVASSTPSPSTGDDRGAAARSPGSTSRKCSALLPDRGLELAAACPPRSRARGRSPRSGRRAGRPPPGTGCVSSTVVPSADDLRGRCPRPGCGCAGRGPWSARRGTGARACDQAGGDVDAAPHAARVGPHLLGRPRREAERRRAARSRAPSRPSTTGPSRRPPGRGSRGRSDPRRPRRTGR